MKKERFIKKDNGEYCDNNTGEILTAEGVITLLQKEKKRASELVSSEILKLRKENNILTRKDTHYFDWNSNKNSPVFFSKSYKHYQKGVSRDMDIFEEGMMAIFTRHLESESNRVIINGKSPSNKELERLTKLGTSKVKETLSKLRKKNLIVTQGRGMGREIYVSPYWAFDGKDIEKSTLDLFGIEY